MTDNKSTTDKVFVAVEGAVSIFGNIQNILIASAVIGVLAVGTFAYMEIKGAINFVGDTAVAIKDAGVEGVSNAIDSGGKAITATVDKSREVANTVKESVDFTAVAETGKKADQAIDKSIDWVGTKLDRWKEKTE